MVRFLRGRFFIIGLMVSFLLGIGAPSQGLSDKGRNLLEELKTKLAPKTDAPSPASIPSASDPATAIEQAQPPVVTPPAVVPVQVAPTEVEPALEKPKKKEKKRKSKEPKEVKESVSPSSAAAEPKPSSSQSQKTDNSSSHSSDMSSMIKSIKEKMEKNKSEKDSASEAQAEGSVKDPTESSKKAMVQPPAKPSATNSEPPAGKAEPAKTSLSAGDGRSFGELSDDELIRYAQEHVWASEKSRRHNPPWTPPSKPKKSKKTVEAMAPKAAETGKASSKEVVSNKSKKTTTKSKTKK